MPPALPGGGPVSGWPGCIVTRFVMCVNPGNVGDLPELPDESALFLPARSKFRSVPLDLVALKNRLRQPQQPVAFTINGPSLGRAGGEPG